MNLLMKVISSSKILVAVTALTLATLLGTSFTSCTHDEVRRGVVGAGGGAIVGGILGGRRGAAAGAVAGGLLGAGTSPSRYMRPSYGYGYGRPYVPARPPMAAYGYYPY